MKNNFNTHQSSNYFYFPTFLGNQTETLWRTRKSALRSQKTGVLDRYGEITGFEEMTVDEKRPREGRFTRYFEASLAVWLEFDGCDEVVSMASDKPSPKQRWKSQNLFLFFTAGVHSLCSRAVRRQGLWAILLGRLKAHNS